MKTIKVLHLASFDGNIGDNANHTGTRSLLKKNLSFSLEFTNLEIREFHWKKRKFDESFINLANQYDLILIGGGNYFELWVESSSTGTTIDLNPGMLQLINPPILFYGLGCDPYKGVTDNTLKRFRSFLDYVLASPKYLVSVRNDGSVENIGKYIGVYYADKIYKVPDGGFFTQVEAYNHPQIKKGKRYVGINLAGDMLDLRFNNTNQEYINYEMFLDKFTRLLEKYLSEIADLHLVFIPHIFRDLSIISDLLNLIDDPYRRQRITVAPYLHGEGAQEYIFDLYRKCLFIMGMRFHTSVCGLGLNIPTIGVVAYPKIKDLYHELGIPQRAIPINKIGFESKLDTLISQTIQNREAIKNDYAAIKNSLTKEANTFHNTINKWLKTIFN